MATLVLGVVGGVVGSFVGMPAIGFMVGSALGSLIDQSLKKPVEQEGPRLTDRRVQSSTYGEMLPILHGTMAFAGNLIWAAELEEHSHTEDEGGKGGGPSTEVTTYSYFGSFAVSLCEGPALGIKRIWANGRLYYDSNAQGIGYSSGNANWHFYPGDETQLPDPTMQAHLGAGNVPAYRGQAYVVFTSLPLAAFNNSLPMLMFEVVKEGGVTAEAQTISERATTPGDNRTPNYVIYGTDGALWHTNYSSGTTWYRVDPYTGERLATWDAEGPFAGFGCVPFAPAPGGTFWGDGRHGVDTPPPGTAATAGLYLISPSTRSVAPIMAESGVEYTYCHCAPFGSDLFGIAFVLSGNLWASRASSTTRSSMRGAYLGTYVADWDVHSHMAEDYVFRYGACDGRYYWAALNPISGSTHTPTDRYHLLRFDVDDMQLVDESLPPSTGAAINSLYYRGSLYVAGAGFIDKWDPATMTHVARLTYSPAFVTRSPRVLSIDETGNLLHSCATTLGDNAALVDWVTFEEIDRFHLPQQAPTSSGGFDIEGIGLYQRDPFGSRVIGTGYIGTELLYRLATGLLDPELIPLSQIVEELCARVDLPAARLDTGLLTGAVRGHLIARQSTVRAVLEPLASAFFFDGLESDSKLKFVSRAAFVASTIPEDDLAVTDQDQAPGLELSRLQDVDLPRTCNVTYFAPSRDYQVDSQYERRLGGHSSSDVTVAVPIALSADEAKQIAQTWLYNAWIEREKYSFSTGIKYAALEPSDLVNVRGINIRLVKRTEEGLLLKWDGTSDASTIYIQEGAGSEGEGGQQTPPVPSSSEVLYLDIPLLRDQDDHAGFYIAAHGIPETAWPGASVWKSSDGGFNYSLLYAITASSVFGFTDTALGSWTGLHNIFDELHTVTVSVNGDLSGTTELAVLNGDNHAMIGSECVQFKYAELQASGQYILSGFLRGRLGTEWACSGHAVNERFVLLTRNLRDTAHPAAELNVERHYKAVTAGYSLDLASQTAFTNTGVRLECYAPHGIGGGRASTNDWVINWKRRTRYGDGWQDFVDAPLGETDEAYEIDIMQSTTVKRTLTATTQTVTYTSAQQTTDFGSAQSTISVRVYQMSSVAGRGYVGSATLPSTVPA